MAAPKTRPTDVDVTSFIDSVEHDRRRAEGHKLRALMERITGAPATMWGPSMIGFGSMPYTNTTGTYEWPVVGFSPRKTALTIYGIYDGYGSHDPLFDELGPHSTGKGCVYIKNLSTVNEEALGALIAQAWSRSKVERQDP
ncbi:MAG: DUF1801 domain-containing protein [Microthrixaceae bacterium]